MWLFGARTGDYCFSRTFPHSNDSGIMRSIAEQEGLESAGKHPDVTRGFAAADCPDPITCPMDSQAPENSHPRLKTGL